MIVKEYNIFEKGINAIVVTVGLLLCIWTATTMKATVATAIGLIPFLLTFIFICIKSPTILLCITFIINYIIMGINRYYPIPIPITNIFDLLFGIMLTLIILKQVYTDDDNRKNAMNAYTFVLLGWLLYCIINAGNGITGELYPEAWLRILRPWAIYPLLTCFILSIHCNRYSFLHYFLILWGIFKNRYLKLFYFVVSMAGFYGLLIAGTRAAIAIPIAGLGVFLFLSKNWKIGMLSFLLLVGGMGILKYTKIGEDNRLIRRMRTVFDSNDQSLLVRFENQKALKAYMSEMPFGIGMGVQNGVISPQNKYYFVSICPADSSLVDVWIQMGVVGLSVFLGMHAVLFILGAYIILFRISNPEIRGPLTGMLCGCAGMLVASYANMVYFQFPNGILIYSCFTFIFLGPHLDRLYTKEHEQRTT